MQSVNGSEQNSAGSGAAHAAYSPFMERLPRYRTGDPELDAAIAELEKHGVSWAGEIVESEWYRYRGLHDPEGNLVYLTEPLLDRRDPPVPAPEAAR